jgi:hypothetical protein
VATLLEWLSDNKLVKDSALPLTIGDTSDRGKSARADYQASGRLRHVLQESDTLSAKHYVVKMNAVHQFMDAFMLLNEQAKLGINASGLWKLTDVSEHVSPPGKSKSMRIASCEFGARHTAPPYDVGHMFLWLSSHDVAALTISLRAASAYLQRYAIHGLLPSVLCACQ